MFFSGFFQQRYVVTIFGFFLTALTSIAKYSIAITLTEMVKDSFNYEFFNSSSNDVCPVDDYIEISNSTKERKGEFDWSSESQGLIISAVFWLYAFMQSPFGFLIDRYGAKIIIVTSTLASGLLMISLPFAARIIGVPGVIVVRVLIGVGQAACYPCLSNQLANWMPPQEKSQLGSIVLTGENIGIVVAMALSGLILGNIENSWALTFYLYGFIMIVWALLYIKFVYNDPNSNPYISEKEKEYLKTSISKRIEKKNLPPLPLKLMAKSPALWGSLIAHFGHDWGIISITSDLPRYMKYVLHYNIEENGLLSAVPFMIISITAVLGGWLSDFLLRRKLTSITTSRKLLATISSVGPALGLTGVIYVGCNKAISVLMLTIGMGFMGFFYSSLGINPSDLSSNYAGTVMGIIGGYATASGIFSPYITGIITKHHTLSEWRTAFGISIAMLTVTDLIFVLIGSGEIQPWDEPTQPQKQDTDN